MEKMIYPLWKKAEQSQQEFLDGVLGGMVDALWISGVHQVRVNAVDEAVEPAKGLRQSSGLPVFDAMVSLWVDSSVYRAEQEKILAEYCDHFHGYLVTESEPLVVDEDSEGEPPRVPGMCQVCFFRKREALDYQEWINIWHGSHTQVAIDTQSTFGYRQNVVARPLTENAPTYHAIVEENFPDEAMTSPEAFFDAVGDPELLKARRQEMSDSCVRFIDFTSIEVVPTSEYLFQ